ncbi:MAG: trimethylamine methyltransferase family protein, partial [Anaerolineae bacterium]|nr:trimethylamine methyltransferase family protein [Anaerolineae bacterium]
MTRRRRRRDNRAKPVITSMSQPLTLSLPRLNLISPAQVEQIHAASLKILAETGVRFISQTALRYFQQAGLRVEGERVYFERAFIEECLALAPKDYTLTARNPDHNVLIGGDNCAVMTGGGPPYVRDLNGVRRPGTLADVENFGRLSAMSPDVHVMARKAVEAQDVPVP